MEKDLKRLIDECMINIKGLIKENEIEKFLPISDNKIEIQKDNKNLYFKLNNGEISYIYKEDDYYSNLEILKRIAYSYGITTDGDNAMAVLRLEKAIKNLLKVEDK